MRTVIAALVVVGLAIGVVVLWPRSTADEPPVGGATTTTSTSTSAPADTTTTTAATTSTTATPDDHVVETVEEAEAILRELWFGWFEGIYNEDEDRIREVVGNPAQIEAAVEQFGVMEFDAAPTREAIGFDETQILLATENCLAVWSNVDATSLVGERNDGVHVFIRNNRNWLFISQWANRGDLWEDDCQSQLP
jgi:hypothetical protein